MEQVEEVLKDAVNNHASDGPTTRKNLEQVEWALNEAVENTSRAIANAAAHANSNSQPDAVDIVTVLAYIRYELTDMVAKCVSAENMKERALLLISFIDSKENSLKDSGSLIDNRIVKQETSDGSFKDISDAYSIGGIGGSSSTNFQSMEWKTESAIDDEATIIEDSTSEEETKRRRRRKRGPRKSLTPRKALTPKQRKALKIVLPKISKTKTATTAAKKVKAPKTSSRQCNICHKTFANRSACCKHKKQLHADAPAVSCTWCKKDFKRKEDYKLHLVRSGHINFIDRKTDKAGKIVKDSMDRYIEKLLGCEFCDRIFDRMSAFKGHMRVHVNEIPGEENPPNQNKSKHSPTGKGPRAQVDTYPPDLDDRDAPLPGHGNKAFGGGAMGEDPNYRGDPHNIMPTDFTSNILYKNQQSDPLDMMAKTSTSDSSGTNDQGLNMKADQSGDNQVGTHDGDRLVCHQCPYCSFFSYNEDKLKEHQKCHDSERPYQCKICEKRFTVEPCLEQHQSVHSEEKPHCCDSCGKTYPSLSQLYAHEYSHIGISNYKCDRCAASFTSKAGLERHMNFHDGKRDHICDICGKSFFAKSELTGHIRAHHKKKVFMHSCEICQKPFVSRGELNKHMTVHSDERPFMCASCGKGFSRKIYLSKHMIIHTMERPYKCTKCPKAFAFVSNLTTHERIHTGEKPYSCHVCGKRSSDVANHIKHMKIHKKDGAPSGTTSQPRRQQQYRSSQPSQHLQQSQQQQQQQQEQQQPPPQQQPLPVTGPPPIFQQPPPQQEPLNLNPAAFDPNFHMMDGSPYEAYRRHEFPWASFARP